ETWWPLPPSSHRVSELFRVIVLVTVPLTITPGRYLSRSAMLSAPGLLKSSNRAGAARVTGPDDGAAPSAGVSALAAPAGAPSFFLLLQAANATKVTRTM